MTLKWPHNHDIAYTLNVTVYCMTKPKSKSLFHIPLKLNVLFWNVFEHILNQCNTKATTHFVMNDIYKSFICPTHKMTRLVSSRTFTMNYDSFINSHKMSVFPDRYFCCVIVHYHQTPSAGSKNTKLFLTLIFKLMHLFIYISK